MVYFLRRGSIKNSLNNKPSVTYRILVDSLVTSSNRTLYPTSKPTMQCLSDATRCATEMAATLRGCVQTTDSFGPRRSRYCGICVVLPEPVSPTTINI